MGTSVSSTRTHERIQQQRQQRKQGKYNGKTKNMEQFYPLNERQTTRQNPLNQKPYQQKVNKFEIQTLQQYSIKLKTQQQVNPQEKKETEIKHNENHKFTVPKKQSLKENFLYDQNILTISKHEPSKQINSQSSLQQIVFSSKKLQNSVENQLKSKAGNSTKPNVSLQQQVIQQNKSRIIKHEPVSLNPQFSQFADKQLAQRQRKRKQQAIKYIKDSQFLNGSKNLSNSPYQTGNKNPSKVEQLLPSRNLEIDLSPKTNQNNDNFNHQTIKLKTQVEELDFKKGNSSMALNKNHKNVNSSSLVNKRY